MLEQPKVWLVTGVAGFIGSNLLEALLLLNQNVVGLDNFSTGYQHNLDEVQTLVTPEQWSRFKFFEGDIRNPEDCQRACNGVDYVLHEAAIGSVPRSIENPIFTNQNNVDGFLNMLVAAKEAKVKSFTYAASSSTYGDHPGLPKVEDQIGKPLSPYAVTKYVNELYADVFARCYGFSSIGLRYFNVFGKRQDPNGAYAAVIPKWIAAMIQDDSVYINGDGETSRDFCYVANAVQANILAATAIARELPVHLDVLNGEPGNLIFNVAVGERTSLNKLCQDIKNILEFDFFLPTNSKIINREFRDGDVRHSLADITKAVHLLDYQPSYPVKKGLYEAMAWYLRFFNQDLGSKSSNDFILRG